MPENQKKLNENHTGTEKMETVEYRINELMHGQKKRLLSTVRSYIGKGIQHTSHQSASWLYNDLCPLAEKFSIKGTNGKRSFLLLSA